MRRHEKRLYVAVYPSGNVVDQERKYHWALLVGAEVEAGADDAPGARYHVRNHPLRGWVYEEAPLASVQGSRNLLARIAVATVANEGRLAAVLRRTPVVQDDPGWRCRAWVADALARVAREQVVAREPVVAHARLDWPAIEATAREFVAAKAAAGRYARPDDALRPKPTWDMVEQRESVP